MFARGLFFKVFNYTCSETKSICTSNSLYAARKGTRLKALAKKRATKKEVVKEVFIPYQKKLEMAKVGTISPRVDDNSRGDPIDDVYFRYKYKWKIYSIEEAVEMHRETAHPTQYNLPNADVFAHIELSMKADKKNQYIHGFSNIVLLPHQFDVSHNRTILTICQDEETVQKLRQMDVTLSLGPEAVKMVEKGNLDVQVYEHLLCHSSLLPNLIPIRNILKRKFPSAKNSTAGPDLEAMATRLLKGIQYEAVKDKYDHDFGKIFCKIGSLEMSTEMIEENLRALVKDVEMNKPQTRSKDIITLVSILCEASREKYKIDHLQFYDKEKIQDEKQLEDDDKLSEIKSIAIEN